MDNYTDFNFIPLIPLKMRKEELLKTLIICGTILVGLFLFQTSISNKTTKQIFIPQAGEWPKNSITVHGKWEVFATPDTATLVLSITKTKPTTKEAQAFVNKKISEVQTVLKSFPIRSQDIQTENIHIGTEYDYGFWGNERKIKGYTASYTMKIILRQLDENKAKEIEKLINTLTSIESVGIDDLSYDIQDKTKLFSKARTLAMQKAEQKAEELAKLAQITIGKPISIAEEINYQPLYYKQTFSQSNSAIMDETNGETTDSTIALGQIKISVILNASYPIIE